MANKNQRIDAPKVSKDARQIGRRSLRDIMDVTDDVITGVLNDTLPIPKANTIVGAVRAWQGGLNVAIRAAKTTLPEDFRMSASLPPATTV